MHPPDLSSLMISMGDFEVEKRFVRSDVMRSEERTRMIFTIRQSLAYLFSRRVYGAGCAKDEGMGRDLIIVYWNRRTRT